MYLSWKINNIAKLANSVDNGAREMEFGGGKGGEQMVYTLSRYLKYLQGRIWESSFLWNDIIWQCSFSHTISMNRVEYNFVTWRKSINEWNKKRGKCENDEFMAAAQWHEGVLTVARINYAIHVFFAISDTNFLFD